MIVSICALVAIFGGTVYAFDPLETYQPYELQPVQPPILAHQYPTPPKSSAYPQPKYQHHPLPSYPRRNHAYLYPHRRRSSPRSLTKYQAKPHPTVALSRVRSTYPVKRYPPAPQKPSRYQVKVYPTPPTYRVPPYPTTSNSTSTYPKYTKSYSSSAAPPSAKPPYVTTSKQTVKKDPKIIVAHRGASGYLPGNTLASTVLAFQMDADYIEQDVVMTRDNYLVVVHGIHLDGMTNVEDIFPGRNRSDGKYYVIDFTLQDIKRLRSTVNFDVDETEHFLQEYPNRFPLWTSDFGIHTFEEEIELIQGMNKVLSKNVGIMPEIKQPWFHKMEGRDIITHVLKVLKRYGYTTKDSKCYIQVFDPTELEKIHDRLLPQLGMDLKLMQLMALTSWNYTYEIVDGELHLYNYDWMFEQGAMQRIATYADAVGPWYPMVINDQRQLTVLVENAHKNNLKVIPYTFRADKGKLPPYSETFEDMLNIFFNKAKIDGIFTDFPDMGVKWRDSNK